MSFLGTEAKYHDLDTNCPPQRLTFGILVSSGWCYFRGFWKLPLTRWSETSETGSKYFFSFKSFCQVFWSQLHRVSNTKALAKCQPLSLVFPASRTISE
jgi:hypothetical protein